MIRQKLVTVDKSALDTSKAIRKVGDYSHFTILLLLLGLSPCSDASMIHIIYVYSTVTHKLSEVDLEIEFVSRNRFGPSSGIGFEVDSVERDGKSKVVRLALLEDLVELYGLCVSVFEAALW